jgi:hypothetical protein
LKLEICIYEVAFGFLFFLTCSGAEAAEGGALSKPKITEPVVPGKGNLVFAGTPFFLRVCFIPGTQIRDLQKDHMVLSLVAIFCLP